MIMETPFNQIYRVNPNLKEVTFKGRPKDISHLAMNLITIKDEWVTIKEPGYYLSSDYRIVIPALGIRVYAEMCPYESSVFFRGLLDPIWGMLGKNQNIRRSSYHGFIETYGTPDTNLVLSTSLLDWLVEFLYKLQPYDPDNSRFGIFYYEELSLLVRTIYEDQPETQLKLTEHLTKKIFTDMQNVYQSSRQG